ncbi:MAG: 4Fe-4S binding protein [Desulfomonile tiedjei]|nr:4Fe-4S binding protein [Desulfomonile tiedjei]
MARYQIEVSVKDCAGCLRCELACSDAHTKAFNPSASRIRVSMSSGDCRIDFTEDCVECGICADQCFYGALSKSNKDREDQ